MGNAALLVRGFFLTGIFADFLYKSRWVAITVYREGLGEGARSAPFCLLMSLKRQVRIANGRVTQPKPTSYLYGT